MSDTSEMKWKDALASMFDLLDEAQYKKMLEIFQESQFLSPQIKTAKFKRELPQKLIERFGLEESIRIVDKAMKTIPRNDHSVQNLLKPFREKLDMKAGCAPVQVVELPAMTIRDLKSNKNLGQRFIAGKVVQKTSLRTNMNKSNVETTYFKLAVADKTDCIEVMVNGNQLFHNFKEESFYTFREVTMAGNVVKITKKSKISQTSAFDIPKSVELEAMKLLDSPPCSVSNLPTNQKPQKASKEGTIKEMSDTPKMKWRDAMTKIFDLLDEAQYKKMLEIFQESQFLSPQIKTAKFKRELPQKLIERFGLEESIRIVDKAMKTIPRNDHSVQNLLKPFREKLDMKAGGAPVQSGELPAMTIKDLKSNKNLGQHFIAGKVVRKTSLRTSINKNEVKTTYFKLAVADKTECIKVMVYGEQLFHIFQEESFYTFRDVLMAGNLMKITKKSKIVLLTSAFDIPKNVVLEAIKLLDSPLCSVANIRTNQNPQEVTVEGTIKEIDCCEPIHMHNKRAKQEKLDFRLEDQTGSIMIRLWHENIRHIQGLIKGDVVTVFNLETNHYPNTVTLNSTDFTRINQVRRAAGYCVTI